MSGGAEREVIFEITRIGDAQRVAAIDVASGVEVVVQTPASAALADAQALALRKLERALRQRPRADDRPGKLV
ncbi:MAG: hypothetical protein JNM59_07245 [Hyphomonadaceae bacterium]|nr:hypothetical protein [Hyphomonadaceae bacterium]